MKRIKALKDMGLTQYEASAYVALLTLGVSTAHELSRKSDVPMGKIYEVLSSLKNLGIVEFQMTRPRMYKAKKPSIALDNLYSKKEEEAKKQLDNLKFKLNEIEEIFSEVPHPDHTYIKFWYTTIGEDEILKKMKHMLEETKQEILIVKPKLFTIKTIMNKTNINESSIFEHIVAEAIKAAEKGMIIKTIAPEELIFSLKQKFDTIQSKNVKKNVYLKYLDCDHDFILVDNSIIFIPIHDPLNPTNIFGQLKVYDKEYGTKLKEKHDQLWMQAKPVM
ncbi:TrmB family transcriptional regulator [Methanosalsum natronophilum]|uniref:TrmB family transcriptional regulator n=1 Tax=Methanosalsum natronophilum TaxID=768733 RepID=UPI0021685B2B|nr:helix-turn-helix domain-containing protein [Methanosalsum natronophilum]MCS3923902.1 sugar-specific transcriptional regulator TrmB [Methanosalsum natronophilum]